MATSTAINPQQQSLASMLGVPSASSGTSNDAINVSSDRFLKLLVAQMNNQDPLNPLDNAQVTSQMAQINTVTGLDKVNSSVQALSAQFMQTQMMQGAALVGRDVIVPGDRLSIADGVGMGGFELSGPAGSVRVQITTKDGTVVDSFDLGGKAEGIHRFEWDATSLQNSGIDPSNLRFKVLTSTAGVVGEGKPLMRDRVNSVNATGTTLNLQLDLSGSLPYSKVKGFG